MVGTKKNIKPTPAQELETHLTYLKLSPTREYKFHPTRRWRFDFAWPDIKFAVEVEGGIYIQGRHTRGVGYEKDLEKYSEAFALGWIVLRVSTKLIQSGRALELIEAMLNNRIPWIHR